MVTGVSAVVVSGAIGVVVGSSGGDVVGSVVELSWLHSKAEKVFIILLLFYTVLFKIYFLTLSSISIT
jgi:hypothetical protein